MSYVTRAEDSVAVLNVRLCLRFVYELLNRTVPWYTGFDHGKFSDSFQISRDLIYVIWIDVAELFQKGGVLSGHLAVLLKSLAWLLYYSVVWFSVRSVERRLQVLYTFLLISGLMSIWLKSQVEACLLCFCFVFNERLLYVVGFSYWENIFM